MKADGAHPGRDEQHESHPGRDEPQEADAGRDGQDRAHSRRDAQLEAHSRRGTSLRRVGREARPFLRARTGVVLRLAGWSLLEFAQTFFGGFGVARALDDGFLAGRPTTGLLWLAVAAVAVLPSVPAARGVFGRLADLVEPLRDGLVRRAVSRALSGALDRSGDVSTRSLSQVTHQSEIARDGWAGLVLTLRSFVFTVAGAVTGLLALSPALLLIVLPPWSWGPPCSSARCRRWPPASATTSPPTRSTPPTRAGSPPPYATSPPREPPGGRWPSPGPSPRSSSPPPARWPAGRAYGCWPSPSAAGSPAPAAPGSALAAAERAHAGCAGRRADLPHPGARPRRPGADDHAGHRRGPARRGPGPVHRRAAAAARRGPAALPGRRPAAARNPGRRAPRGQLRVRAGRPPRPGPALPDDRGGRAPRGRRPERQRQVDPGRRARRDRAAHRGSGAVAGAPGAPGRRHLRTRPAAPARLRVQRLAAGQPPLPPPRRPRPGDRGHGGRARPGSAALPPRFPRRGCRTGPALPGRTASWSPWAGLISPPRRS